MISYIVIGSVSCLVAGITLFSGFGLGTVLMPAFAIFFPLKIAIAATAIVHLANNIIKGILVGRYADIKITLLFVVPAIPLAFLGAWLLNILPSDALYTYTIQGKAFSITLVKIIIGLLMALFSLFELNSKLAAVSFGKKFIPLGGALSGFFGGVSGHQGAFRSTFLLKAGLTKNAFVGTTVLAAILVDISRIVVYGITFLKNDIAQLQNSAVLYHVVVGSIAAFLGVFIGSRLIEKITYRFIQLLVGVLLFVIAVGLISGLL